MPVATRVVQSSKMQGAACGAGQTWKAAPYLSREAENELFLRWHKVGDGRALEELVAAHMRLVAKIARRFRRYCVALDDLMQEGAIGLIQAADRFDPTHGARFATYARWWVQAAIWDFVIRNSSIVRTSATSSHLSIFRKLAMLKAKAGFDCRLTERERVELARELDTTVDAVTAIEMRVDGADVSINARISPDSSAELQDFLGDGKPSPEALVSEAQEGIVLSRTLNSALQTLDERERLVVQQRYLREESATLETLGRQLGVSKERTRQIEQRAVKKLADTMQGAFAI